MRCGANQIGSGGGVVWLLSCNGESQPGRAHIESEGEERAALPGGGVWNPGCWMGLRRDGDGGLTGPVSIK